MAIGKDGAALRRALALFNVGAVRELSDGQLLERFATGQGESAELAFAALVERHGPMVLRVCRGILADPHDAQDAFQATFLVLVRKGRGLWVRDSLGPWLHQVACRAASAARSASARRRRFEQRAAGAPAEGHPGIGDELIRVIHEEIGRLPERFRSPVILCDLEGRTHEQAARHLGWPIGTVKSRLSRARGRLRDRLSRRGLAPGPGGFAVAGPIPPALVDATAGAAIRFLATRAIGPGPVANLAHGVIQLMNLIQCLKVASVVLLLGATSSGIALLAQDGPPAAANPPAAPRDDVPSVKVGPGNFRVTVSETGLVERPKASAVRSEIEGQATIVKILPDESKVKQGDVVAELDSATLRDTLTNQRIAAQQAEANFKQAVLTRELAEYAIKEYVQGTYGRMRAALASEVDRAQSDVERDNARLERARRVRKRLEELADPGAARTPSDLLASFVIEDVLGDAGRDLDRDTASLDQAKSRLQTFERDRDREILRIMKLKEEDGDPDVRQLRSDVEKARADELARRTTWELEKTRAANLERQIRACTLRAPADGVIVLARTTDRQVPLAEGMAVRERQKIFDVVDIGGPVRLVVKVPESMVDQVRPGLAARIKGVALGKKLLSGTVESVAGQADATAGPASGRKVYTTRVAIPASPLAVRSDLLFNVEIIIAELDDVIAVPVASVILNDGKYHVLVRKAGGGVDWREVTLGTSNGEVIEIKQGLQAGESVVLNPVALMMEEEGRRKPGTSTPAPR